MFKIWFPITTASIFHISFNPTHFKASWYEPDKLIEDNHNGAKVSVLFKKFPNAFMTKISV